MNTSLACAGLSFSYGDTPILTGVTLRADAGEVVGLVGPNGSGKTTLLKSLAGLLEAKGEIVYNGDPLTGLSSRQRADRRAYVPQNTHSVFPYRVDAVVSMGSAHRARFYGVRRDDAGVAAVLSEVGFIHSPSRRFDRLSGGERQQVIVARAFLQGAGVLLLDEPTSALDLKHCAAVMTGLCGRAKRGAVVLMSLHDLNLAAVFCDRLLLLNGGKLVAEGTPNDVLKPDMIAQVYGVRVSCGTHPRSGAIPTVHLDPQGWSADLSHEEL